MVADNVSIRRGHLAIRGTSLARDALLLRRLRGARRRRSRAVVVLRSSGVGAAVVHAVGLVLVVRGLDVDVGDAAVLAVAHGLVLVRRLGELGDDVPGVEEARDEAQAAEEDVDEGVGAADAALDPDCRVREELQVSEKSLIGYFQGVNSKQRSILPLKPPAVQRQNCVVVQGSAFAGRGRRHTGGWQCQKDVPGSGGKRMARTPRKMSAEHMVYGLFGVTMRCKGIKREQPSFRRSDGRCLALRWERLVFEEQGSNKTAGMRQF